jgi:hypothetical protein
MKRKALIIITALLMALMCVASASAQKKDKVKEREADQDFEPGEQMERTVAASQNVLVTVCLASGNIQVRGWDRPEVKVTATSVRQLELQGGGMNPPQRVEVALSNNPKTSTEEPLVCDCRGVSDLNINVPRGATIELQVRSGDIEVAQVAEARIKNTSGDVSVSNVTREVDVVTISGDVSLLNSAGRVRLVSVSGDVDATNIRAVEASDDFSATSTSGDINLEGVEQARVSANNTSGTVTLTGNLASHGSYNLNTFSGDVVLNIPQDSAFRLNARAPQGSITTDFVIKSRSEGDSQNLLEGGTLTGYYGARDWASLTIQSFSGTVRLQKR